MSELILSILVVDDDPTNAELVKERLANIESGWKTDFDYVTTGQEGLERAIEENQFHVIFLDYQLGAKNALDVIGDLRDGGYERPVVLLTEDAPGTVVAKAFREGFDDYVDRDELSPAELKRTINYVLKDFFKSETEQAGQRQIWTGKHDPVTKVWNRAGLLDRIKEDFARQTHTTLLLIGINNLRQINESRGQSVGDEILINTVQVINEEIGDDGIIGRPQGSSFAVLLPDLGKGKSHDLGTKVLDRLDEKRYDMSDGNNIPVRFEATVIARQPSSNSAQTFLERGLEDLASVQLNGDQGLRAAHK